MAPLIGITGSGVSELSANSKLHDSFHSVPSNYVDCVVRAGGLPMILPPVKTDTVALLARLDGIIFTGGADMHPEHYEGNTGHHEVQDGDTLRDLFELELMQQALMMNDLPIFGICRGAQVMNVALGGSLHEHLPEHIEEDIHRNDSGGWTRHEVLVNANSLLHKAMGAELVHTDSGHHQALARVATGLRVVASAADDVVEAVEFEAHPWCFAVQWHPERTASFDETQQNLFDNLVHVARQRSAQR